MRSIFGDSESSLTGISRDIATASEESINGLAAGINTQNYYISHVPGIAANVAAIKMMMEVDTGLTANTGFADLILLQNQSLSHLQGIERYTSETAAECRRIALACEAEVKELKRVIVPKGVKGTHGVTVYLQ